MHSLIFPGDIYDVSILHKYIRFIQLHQIMESIFMVKKISYNKPIAASFVICNLIHIYPDIDTRGWRNNAASCLKVFLTIRR